MSVKDFHTLFLNIISAIYEAHSLKITNNDIKPENVYIDKDKDGNLEFFLGDWGGSAVILG